MSVIAKLEVNPAPIIDIHELSNGDRFIIIDDFLLNPEAAVLIADSRIKDFQFADRSYPGIVLGIGEGVMTDIYQFVRSKLYKHLYFLRGGVKFSTHLSLTTLQPS